MSIIEATRLVSMCSTAKTLILTTLSGSRTERERLEEGIISEAKRMVSFDFVKRYALIPQHMEHLLMHDVLDTGKRNGASGK